MTTVSVKCEAQTGSTFMCLHVGKTGRSEMGLLLFGCLWSPPFGKCVTSTVFHFDGKTHVRKDLLTIDVTV